MYRPHLDGLRGYGVLVVIAFHAGWSGGRGIGGMDAFFTVSSFLITTLVLAEHAAGEMSIVRFWGRRARRLIPALAVMLVTVTLLSRFVDSPAAWEARRADVTAAALYYANWHFQALDSAYLVGDYSLGSPLVHTWSLAIEEQFYLVFPVLFWLTVRFGRAGRAAALTLLGLGFVGSVWFGMTNEASLIHYDTRARAFAILAGVAAALVVHARLRPGVRVARLLGWIVAPLAPVLVVFLTPSVVDSARWMFVMLAASVCVLLVVGEVLSAHPLVRVFASRPLVWVGQRTYGLYLWHLPLIVYVPRLVPIPRPWASVVAVALTFVVAECSLRLIERPVRRVDSFIRHPGLVSLGSVGILLAVVFAAHSTLPSAPRWDVLEAVCEPGNPVCIQNLGDMGFAAISRTNSASGWNCADDAIDLQSYHPSDTSVLRGDPLCVLYEAENPALIVGLVGDSTAKMLAPGLLLAAAERNWTLVTAAKQACPWMLPDERVIDPERGHMWRCQPATLDAQLRLIAEFGPDVIVFNDVPTVDFTSTPPEQAELEAAARLTAAGARLVAAGPLLRALNPECVGVDSPACLSISGNMHGNAARVAGRAAQLEVLAERFPVVIGTHEVNLELCGSLETCSWERDGFPLFTDSLHVTNWGSVQLSGVLAKLVERAANLPPAKGTHPQQVPGPASLP